MKTARLTILALGVAFGLGNGGLSWAAPIGTAFTYQGQLKEGGVPVNTNGDFEFSLWDAATGGSPIGLTLTVSNETVVNGLFTVSLDFSTNGFTGDARWLQIAVRVPHDPTDTLPYTTLSPRQELTPTPYALYAAKAGSPDGHSLDAADGSPTDVVYVANDGKVGIGTASPSYGLDVRKGINNDYSMFIHNTGGSGQGLLIRGATGYSHVPLFRVEDNYEHARFIVRDDGAVGIGTTNPNSRLEVAGIIHSTSGGFKFPDGSVQTTAAGGGGGGDITAVYADNGLTGGATSGDAHLNVGAGDGIDVSANAVAVDVTDFAGSGLGEEATNNLKVNTGTGLEISSDAVRLTSAYSSGSAYDDRFVNVDGDSMSGSTTGDLFTVTNTGTGDGIYGVATGTFGIAVMGYSYDDGIGGNFQAGGDTGKGLTASASWDGPGTNYGGKFEAWASSGIGVSSYGKGYDFYATGPGVDYGSASSVRWKSNVRRIEEPLYKVLRLRGVCFDWDKEHGGHHDVGMIAEEVGEVLPEIVDYEESGIYASGMDYSKLTPLLVEAVKALKNETDALQEQQTEKDVEIAELTDRLSVLESVRKGNAALRERIMALEIEAAKLTGSWEGGSK